MFVPQRQHQLEVLRGRGNGPKITENPVCIRLYVNKQQHYKISDFDKWLIYKSTGTILYFYNHRMVITETFLHSPLKIEGNFVKGRYRTVKRIYMTGLQNLPVLEV